MTVDPQNDSIARDMLAQLHHFRRKGGKAPSFNNVSPRQEVPESHRPASVPTETPKDEPVSSRKDVESARKPLATAASDHTLETPGADTPGQKQGEEGNVVE